jgi:PAS domain S-box-containing protein
MPPRPPTTSLDLPTLSIVRPRETAALTLCDSARFDGYSVIAINQESMVVSLSDCAEKLTGWSRHEAKGLPLNAVLDIEEPFVDAFISNTDIHADFSQYFPATILTFRDGVRHSVEGCAVKAVIAGETLGSFIVIRHVAIEAKKVPAGATDFSFTQGVASSIPFPLVVLDKTFTVVAANRAFYTLFEVYASETEGQSLSALGTGQWAKIDVVGLLDRLMKGEIPSGDCYVEDCFPLIGQRVMLVTASWVEEFDDPTSAILLTIQDVSNSHYAERAIRRSELQYRRLFESAKDGILILDAQTLAIIDANAFIVDLLGYSYGDLIGRELWEIGFFEDKTASQETYAELQQSGYVRYECLPLKTNSLERAEVEFISNVYMVGDQVIAQCNIRDVSARKRLEQALTAQAKNLSDLHQQKDEFLAMLSHELRNPLAPITNAVRVLRSRMNEDAVMQRACVIIERQLVQLSRLVDDLVEVSRITSGRVQLRSERITIQEVVEHALETTRPLLDQRKHKLFVSLSGAPVWLQADSSRLEQVVVNLLANSAKYTDEEGHIELSVEQENQTCVLRLRDSGIGVQPELLPHIFDLFTQAERSLDRSRGGLGIALALVHRIVALHGGTVEVNSVVGQGTEFIVRLPTAAAPVEVLPAPHNLIDMQPSRILKVLVVDDNVDTAESMTMLVEMLSHTVKTEHDGNTALKTAFAFHPDVVLLDIGLTSLNGYQVASRIREQPSMSRTILVAITGYGHESDRQLAMNVGFDHHLVKPVDLSECGAF